MITITNTIKVERQIQKEIPYAEESGLMTVMLKTLKLKPTA